MNDRKILIWDCFPLKNTGGPAGYLYNLRNYLNDYPNANISFLSDIDEDAFIDNSDGKKHKLCSRSFFQRVKSAVLRYSGTDRILYVLSKRKEFIYTQFNAPLQKKLPIEVLNHYDFIHFHSVFDLTRFIATYNNYTGKTILSSHCPCPVVDEMVEYWDFFCKYFRSSALKMECKAYEMADYIMFPCVGAREPYEKEPRIKRIFNSCEEKFFYVPSSIIDVQVDALTMQKYADLGIPEESFVITYFGRHNYVKGYDTLIAVGKQLLGKYPNLYFLCAGRGDILPLKHPRWIELGFINNTQELLLQSDLYILPNRETYFDLVALEIMRSSTCLILSETGGNKHFHEYKDEELTGLVFYEDGNMEQLLDAVETKIKEKANSPSIYGKYGEANRSLFLNHFTMDKFVENYINEINKL